MKTYRKILCLVSIALLLCNSASAFAQKDEPLLTHLNTVKEGDWRTARAVAEEIVGNTPGSLYETLRTGWEKIEQPVMRQEVVTVSLRMIHPDGLKVALLGLNDPDPEVRNSAAQGVAYALGLSDTLTPEQIKTQIAMRQKRTLEQAREDRVREIIIALRTAKPDAVPELLRAPSRSLWDSKHLRAVAVQAGLLDVLRPYLIAPQPIPATQNAILDMLSAFELPEAFLKNISSLAATKANAGTEFQSRAVNFLGSKKYRPAYVLLKDQLRRDIATENTSSPLFAAADNLAKFGEPELIPFMIGIIAAENNDSKYNVGYFGLGPLTGVPYNEMHDGEWWKLWWDLHKKELPESVRVLTIPEFPRSPRYKDPLPRDVHEDRAKFRSALIARYQQGLNTKTSFDGAVLSELGGAEEIPTLIGLIASDNTYNSIYNIGYFGLTPLTGVPYSSLHDGNWWKLWYEAHVKELPVSARVESLPLFPPSTAFHEPIPSELHTDPAALREKLVNELRGALGKQTDQSAAPTLFEAAQRVAYLNDPRAVPAVIEMLPEATDNTVQILYNLDYHILRPLTGVPYQAKRGHTWWAKWWQENDTEFEKRYLPSTPDFKTSVYRPGQLRTTSVLAADCAYDPRVTPTAGQKATDENPSDIADVPSVRYFAGGDNDKVYRLVGMDPKAPAPKEGYALLVVLPGGDGSDEFRWFVRRIKKNALPQNMLIAQLIAPQWNEWQAKNLVWPTRKNPAPGMKFSTEEFIEAAIADVKKKVRIAPTQVYTMAWSSSGPAVYTYLATKGSSVAGAFIAMSVFRPQEIPNAESLKGKRVFLYHSPQDFIKIQQARDAEAFLKTQGATVRFEEYSGGHGWQGDTFGAFQAASKFLEAPSP